MKTTISHDNRIANLTLASGYPLYLTKIQRKGRNEVELICVIKWLIGFDEHEIKELIELKSTFEELFQKARLNPNANKITGLICGYRVEEIENPLTQKIRYLDKLVDELAKGKKMEKILRS
jgi:hypothetical protein